jgi:hypothetical protein
LIHFLERHNKMRLSRYLHSAIVATRESAGQ